MRLIDADALKEALKSNCKPELCHDINTAWCEHCCRTNDFEDLIDEAPTVEEEDRPHGKWIYHKNWYREEECPWECSECGTCSDNNMNFCGECGADMREDEE